MKILSDIKRLIAKQRGNAVLFSMIIVTAAMTISLGMASLVAGEVRSAGLVLPAERAYYKAESFVEQALWHKKQDPDFEIADVDQLNSEYPNFVCASQPCFSTNPGTQTDLLKEFFATSSPLQEDVTFIADVSQQYDIITTDANGSGSVEFSDITGESGFRGLEVTITAFSKSSSPAAQFPVDDPTTTIVETPITPVFVDKVVIPAGEASRTIQINSALRNPVGEAYPALDSSNVYRLRIKALGADAAADITASSGGTTLALKSPDFTVRSVAEDARSRRGIEVLVPAAERASSIFDFTLFSDLDLDKLRAKVQGTKLLTATVRSDSNRNCVFDANEPLMPDVQVRAQPASGPTLTSQTNVDGIATFDTLQQGMQYTVSAEAPPNTSVCTNNQTVSFSPDGSNESRQVSFLVRLPQRLPLYRAFAGQFGGTAVYDHFYTRTFNEWNAAYHYEFIAGYLYGVQVPGTQPLYRAYHAPNFDHLYTMSQSEYNHWGSSGWATQEGVVGYIYPFTGTCPDGSSPLYRTYDPSGVDHFYTMSASERQTTINGGWHNEGITGCMWTSP